MRISFVMASGFTMSGGDRVIATYARKLHDLGHAVFVISSGWAAPSWKTRLYALMRGQGWRTRETDPASHFTGLQVPHHRLGSARPVRARDLPDADVVIATWWSTAEWVNKLPPQKGAKVYFIQHYEAFDYLPRDLVDATWRLPLHKITVARWLSDMARDRFGDPCAALVPNSVDTLQFHSGPRDRGAVPTIGLVYHEAEWKGFRVGLEALEILRKRLPDLRAVTFANEAPSLKERLPAWMDFILAPAQDKIRDIYARCDVWLCCSKSEGFGLPALEAMACRTPVVSTRSGGPEDFIVDGFNGYLVPVGDASALAERASRVLLADRNTWRQMSDNALATATRYTWDDAVKLFEASLATAVELGTSGRIQCPPVPPGSTVA